ncbi:YmfQ family protein [Salinicola avicenniae]|uniref:YmfQ family protein n=1 Tax=Salinicola avicenniae TaxID=2916836 RepID=UPI002074A67C|nr:MULTISPECIES: putative phage tail protein [unclassified Salinicola]
MAMNAESYREQLAALLPQGAVWPRDGDARLSTLLVALAQEFARVDRRADDVIRESDPRRALELLEDWERNYGLPEPCVANLEQTLQERRDALVSKMTTTGGQSRRYFIDICAALGYDVTIEEFRPFRVGQSCVGDDLTNGPWQFTWRVRAPAVTVRTFKAGRSAVGEPLRKWGNELLECKVSRLAPAHTIVQFAYGD